MPNDRKIPFLDLVGLHQELENELTPVFQKALRTAGFVGGPMVEEFEREFARFCDAAYCVGLASGTDAVRFALMAAAPSIAIALVGAVLGGIGNGVESVSMQTAIQDRTPERWMAVIMSLNEAIANVAPGLGILIGGVITALTSPRIGLATAGVGSLAFAVLALFSLRSAGISSGRGKPDPDAPEGTTTPPLAPSERLV